MLTSCDLKDRVFRTSGIKFTIKQSNQNPIFKKLKNFSYSCLTIEPRINFIARKVIREIKRDKNPQKSLF
ncbi:hypothetical protein FIM43_05920 [Helicobacter pylori]|nr:hypothetical protein DZC36_06335 [Helicobacter pylori]TPH89023.1 hypothetical protein FIM43_05920 [Helicobacter pylori]